MKAHEIVEFTIDPKLKREAEAVLKVLGINHSQAVELFYCYIIEHQDIPAEWLDAQE